MDLVIKTLGLVGLVIVLGLLLSIPTWLLWNGCLVPAVEGLKEISWLQAWGIQVLCTGLFKETVSKK